MYNVHMLKQKTVYFREEDLPLWENVQNKAQFLHDALTTGITTIPAHDVPTKPLVVHRVEMKGDWKLPEKPLVAAAKKNFAFCKNGHPIPDGRDKCMGKGCKYA